MKIHIWINKLQILELKYVKALEENKPIQIKKKLINQMHDLRVKIKNWEEKYKK
jgi:hypothetical protein